MSQSLPGRVTPTTLAALRVVSGALFLGHGLVKLAGFPEGAKPGLQPIASLLGVAALIEVTTGALLVAGLLTRPAAFLASGLAAAAYFLPHAPASFFPVLNGGEPAILFSFIFLLISTAGPGAFALDNLRAARRTVAA